jgi:hypothetical protein
MPRFDLLERDNIWTAGSNVVVLNDEGIRKVKSMLKWEIPLRCISASFKKRNKEFTRKQYLLLYMSYSYRGRVSAVLPGVLQDLKTFRLYVWRKPVFKFEIKDVAFIKH